MATRTEYGSLKSDAERVLLPAIRTFRYVLENFARRASEDVSFSLNFKVDNGGSDPVKAEFICPHEFGDACNLLVESVIAFGGSCHQTENNTVCNLPD